MVTLPGLIVVRLVSLEGIVVLRVGSAVLCVTVGKVGGAVLPVAVRGGVVLFGG